MERAQAAADPRLALKYYRAARLPSGDPGASRRFSATGAAGRGLSPSLGAGGGTRGSAGRGALRAGGGRERSRRGQGKVFLGGHSLGGMLAQCYAAWEFPEGPGHREIDGLVLIDGAVGGPDWTRGTG